jgi:hypothetical protein
VRGNVGICQQKATQIAVFFSTAEKFGNLLLTKATQMNCNLFTGSSTQRTMFWKATQIN